MIGKPGLAMVAIGPSGKEIITVAAARALREEIVHPTGPLGEALAYTLLDRWFDLERRGMLEFESGARELLIGLRPPRRH
jgi:precorrin-2 methylase